MKPIFFSFSLFFVILPSSVFAQITSDGTLENPTKVERQGNFIEITEGTTREKNLFHSFEDFSVPKGVQATFKTEADISSIFGRVTGENASFINGFINSNNLVELYLLNPNGIILGENASLSLDVFLNTISGESIIFEDGVKFSAKNTQETPLLTISFPIGVEFSENSPVINNSSIISFSSFLDIDNENPAQIRSFIGNVQIIPDGTLDNPTKIETKGSQIEITGGTTKGNNLFHSFKDFSINNGREVFFDNEISISRIFSRVTGGSESSIDGLIRTNNGAALYLLNPNGIFLSQTATLDTNSVLYAISGESIIFEDGVEFSTKDSPEPPSLTASLPISFVFPENFDQGFSQVVNFSSIPTLPDEFKDEFDLSEENLDNVLILFGNGAFITTFGEEVATQLGISNETLEITSDGTLDNPTKVEPNGSLIEITEGTTKGGNLFHSFENFSISSGKVAFFKNESGISNIFSRVTGNQVSNIDGFVRLNNPANLYLLNPNGIVFGDTASLDTNALLYAVPGESILFEDGIEFSTKDTIEQPLLTASLPTNFSFSENSVPVEDNSFISVIPIFFSDEFEFLQTLMFLPADFPEENFDKILILSGEELSFLIFDEIFNFEDIFFDEYDDIFFDEDTNKVIETITKNSAKLNTNVINNENVLTSSCVARTQYGSSFFITGNGGLSNQPQDAANAYFSTGTIQTIDSSEITTLNQNRQWKIGDPIIEPTGVYRLPDGQLIISHQCRKLVHHK